MRQAQPSRGLWWQCGAQLRPQGNCALVNHLARVRDLYALRRVPGREPDASFQLTGLGQINGSGLTDDFAGLPIIEGMPAAANKVVLHKEKTAGVAKLDVYAIVLIHAMGH